MAYVRMKGNQVAIVHGERDPETGKSVQRTLCLIYSKVEAREATGASRQEFRHLLEINNPQIAFNWQKIERDLVKLVEKLPDIGYHGAHHREQLEESMYDFARRLLNTDPVRIGAHNTLIGEYAFQLRVISDAIQKRLDGLEEEVPLPRHDHRFQWYSDLYSDRVSLELHDRTLAAWEAGRLDEAGQLAMLCDRLWPKDPFGCELLGRLALERGKAGDALEYYTRALIVSRNFFPKRLPKRDYWGVLETRPFIRAHWGKARALNRAGRYQEALSVLETLASMCGARFDAPTIRLTSLINLGRFREAVEGVEDLGEGMGHLGLLCGLAFAELGEDRRALTWLVAGSLQYPEAARMIAGHRAPSHSEEDTAPEDLNIARHLRSDLANYLTEYARRGVQVVKSLLRNKRYCSFLSEYRLAQDAASRRAGSDHAPLEHLFEMQTLRFAEQKAKELHPEVFKDEEDSNPRRGGRHA